MIQLPLGFLKKHLVSILLVFKENGQCRIYIMTAFVLSVSEQWFLVTAGHCLEKASKLISTPGWKLERSCLLDSLHLDIQNSDVVLFIYEDACPIWAYDEDTGLDYGVLVLSSYYRSLLESNGIQALNEEAWEFPPSNPDFYLLLGIPGELVEVDFDSECVRIEPILYGVERLAERPKGFPERQVPLFYGRIELTEGMTSIEGVSGGPIFAFQQDEQGQPRYWLVAIQSRCLSQSYQIAACPAKILGEALQCICESKDEGGGA